MTTKEEYEDTLDDIIIFFLAERENESSEDAFTKEYIISRFNNNLKKLELEIPENEIISSLERLSSAGFLTVIKHSLAPDYFVTTSDLYNYYSSNQIHGNFFWNARGLPGWINHVITNVAKFYSQRPDTREPINKIDQITEDLSSDMWQPLRLERSGKAFDEVEQSIEHLIESVRSNNGYTEVDLDERDSILLYLKKGLEIVRVKSSSYFQIESLLVTPATYLAKKFSDSLMGEAAKQLLISIKNWIGS